MQKHVPRSLLVTLGLSTALLGITLPVTQALASAPRVVEATPSTIPTGDTIVPTPITASFDVTLAQPHSAAEQTYIDSLYNSASPNYHHFLTPSTFAAKFGATSQTISSVESYFEQYGLTPSSLSTSHITLKVTGPTPKIAQALDAHLATVRISSGALVAQLTSKATLPADIASEVAAISGISAVTPASATFVKAHTSTSSSVGTCSSAGSSATNSPNPIGSGGGYTVQQQAELYGLNSYWSQGDTGNGQTVAIYELAPYDPADVSNYFSCYGVNPTITPVAVDGGAGTNYSSSFQGGGPVEATMDVEELGALLPGATFEVYETLDSGTGPTDEYQKIADDNSASIVSTSWGQCEIDPTGDPSAELPIFEQMAAQGQTVISAAGDSGSTDCQGDTNVSVSLQNSPAADDPASQPWVTGVGGLKVSQISPLVESVWNGGTSGGAGGGGQSIIWSRPSWQNASGITSSDTMRMVPDLSVMAAQSSGFVSYITGSQSGTCRGSGCGWQVIGGTSIGAPLVSALVATASESCGVARLGFINPTLYEIQNSAFNDVTTGSNDLSGGSNYDATTGYDMASGLGSPNANFIADLCPPKFSSANSKFTSDKTAATDDNGASVNVALADVNDQPIANAQVSVTASASGGSIEIDNDSSSTTGNGAASYTVTTDANGDADFNVTTTTPGTVKVSVAYQGTTIYTTSIAFSQSSGSTTTSTTTTTTTTTPAKPLPGAPTIAKLTALSGGFTMTVVASTKLFTGTIFGYQYSLNSGKSWVALPASFTGTTTVKGLLHKHLYSVIVRVTSSNGSSPASAAKSVITK